MASPARIAGLAAGLVLVAAGAALVFSPGWVAETFHRPAATVGERINLRATWGGTLVGLGAFVAAYGSLGVEGPRGRRIAALLVLCTMAGIGAARALGFALDGAPDTAQVVWIVAEVVLAVGAAIYLART